MLLTLGEVISDAAKNGEGFPILMVSLILLTYAVLIFVCLPFHEFAHAFAATRLGDATSKWHGRLSLNPMKHLDVMGTIMMLVCGFGYAKPVPVNSYNFRNPKRGMALTAFAGPLSNLLLAVVAVAAFRLVLLFSGVEMMDVNGRMMLYGERAEIVKYAHLLLVNVFASVNLSLAVFNLLPVPPLDGSRIFAVILPDRFVYVMERYQMYISFALMMILLTTNVLDGPLYFLRQGFGFVICTLLGMPNVF